MSLTTAPYSGTLISDEEMLARTRQAIADVLTGAQAYTIFGGRTVTRADLAELKRTEVFYSDRVLRAKGATGINRADTSERGNMQYPGGRP